MKVISRDRASTYALAAAQAAPDAVQVADRWHLLKNLGETIQRVLETQRPAMREAAERVAQMPSQTQPATTETISPPVAAAPTTHRHHLYQQVKDYQAAGRSKRWIVKETGLSAHTVRKFWSWATYEPKASIRYSSIRPYEVYLQDQWKKGQHHVKTLHLELQTKGYKGSFRSIYRFVARWLRESDSSEPSAVGKIVEYPPRQVSIWLSKPLEDLPNQPIRDYVTKLLAISGLLDQVRQQALCFRDLMANKEVAKLDEWLATTEALDSEPMRQFVRGLRQDYKAVRQAFSSEWSNGQVEGQVNRLKTIKRQMYGRAGFELLRRRVVASG